MSNSTLLTICIPSYNRGNRVNSLVSFILDNILEKHGSEIELIVVNNCSTDDTAALISPYQERGVRLINRADHLPSAEANMFASLDFCSGRYIWFLGDDDIPVPETISDLLESIKKNEADLYVFNPINTDSFGVITSGHLFKMNGRYVDVSGDNIVFACGFTYSLSGISNVVFRREFASKSLAYEVFEIQEIYAHVAWLIRCFSSKKTRICADNIVYYRSDDPVKQFAHFKEYAKKRGLPDRQIWGKGMVDLLAYLVDAGALTFSGVKRIYDGQRDGTRFRLLDEIVNQVYLQVRLSIESHDERNRVKLTDFYVIRDFFYKVDLFLYDLFFLLEKMVNESNAIWERGESRGKVVRRSSGLFEKFEFEFHRILDQNYYVSIFMGRYYNYSLYKSPVGVIGISDTLGSNRREVLSCIDPIDSPPSVYSSSDLDGVFKKIDLIIERQGGISEYGVSKAAPDYEIGAALRHIADEIGSLSSAHNSLAETQQETKKMARESSFLWRLLFWRLPFALPYRMYLKHLRPRFKFVAVWVNSRIKITN